MVTRQVHFLTNVSSALGLQQFDSFVHRMAGRTNLLQPHFIHFKSVRPYRLLSANSLSVSVKGSMQMRTLHRFDIGR